MGDLEKLKMEVVLQLDSLNFWAAIKAIQNAMMDDDFGPYETDLEEEARIPGVLE